MSMIGKVNVGDYELTYNVKINKLNLKIKQAILYNVWAYLYYTYGGPTQDKDHSEAIHIVRSAYYRKY